MFNKKNNNMGSICPAECADFTLTEVTKADCEISYRKINIKSLGFYKCDVKLPSPMTDEAFKTLYESGAIVFSNELVNVSISEPVYEERKLSDTRPADQEIVERQITFEDRIKVEIPEVSGGSSTPANLFADYDFWQNKLDHKTSLNYGFVMSNGDFVAPVDEYGYGMSASFQMHRNFENLTRGGAIEIKAGTLTFLGDPLAMKYKPIINLNDIPELAGKW